MYESNTFTKYRDAIYRLGTSSYGPTPRVWSINDIAALYGRSTKWAERLVKQAEFPQPLRGDKHRWWADEVTAFAKSPSKPASSAEILMASPKYQPITRIARSNARQYSQRTKKQHKQTPHEKWLRNEHPDDSS